MMSFPDFCEDDLEEDATAAQQSRTLRHADKSSRETPRRSRIGYATWRNGGLPVVWKVVHLPPEDVFTDVRVIASRLLCVERARQAEEEEDASAVAATAGCALRWSVPWPLVSYLALHVDDEHHFQWLMERVGVASLRDVMAASRTDPVNCAVQPRLPPPTRSVTRRVVRDTLRGLWVLHEKLNLSHGDVSPSNILLRVADEKEEAASEGGLHVLQVKLGDLEGLTPRASAVATSSGTEVASLNETGAPLQASATCCFRGSPLYAPLEVLEGHLEQRMDADVWALGIVWFQLLSRSGPHAHPFDKGVHASPAQAAGQRHTILGLMDALQTVRAAVMADETALLRLLRESLPGVEEDAVRAVSHCLDWRGQWTAGQLLQLEWLACD